MPTENRSCNTEMVSVPRELADRIQQRLDLAASAFKAAKPERDQFRALLAKPAPQPHPDPIAWMVGTAIWWTKEEAERDAQAAGLPVVAIGPMPTRQDEPAWFMTEGGVSAMHAKAKAMSAQQGLDTSSYCVPLYTHADPGEVERLRLERRRMDQALSACANERDTLRTLLVEALAFLDEAYKHDIGTQLKREIKAFYLSASAEPSAPVAQA
ncbi:hypothetical protein OO258_25970 [Pseudomonas sp. DCB_BI]|uniref:hypothetical protein n=1 Tax=Pseudomonas sp. DCB_BI TaxID=2993594 RepID=UPI00224A7B9D|nr:hypothetical protein [Pseudomonas sp. DCB_BI]MCX2891679.1 hypothetical protein [Pseudomonas sp. DCB_BI]